MKFDFKNILVGLLIGVITTTTFILMVGEVYIKPNEILKLTNTVDSKFR